ncbi:MAG: transglycosylase SLT domain-containing protein [Patescibacteria group bacterium]
MRFFVLSCALFLGLLMPSFTLAADTSFLGNIVPQCPSFNGTHDICRACDLVYLADNLIKFFAAASVLVASLMFAYAGFLYVTAAANEPNLKAAKTVFGNVFIGLILVLVAWLVVDLVLRSLSNQSLNVLTEIQCLEYADTVSSTVLGPNQAAPGTGADGTGGPTPGPGATGVPAGSCQATQAELRTQVTPGTGQQYCGAAMNYRDPERAQRDLTQLSTNTPVMAAINSCSGGANRPPKNVMMGIVSIESDGNPKACDAIYTRDANGQCPIGRGGYGLAQVTLAEARRFDPVGTRGLTDRQVITRLETDLNFNVCAGAAALQRSYNDPRSKGSYANAAVAYNGGFAALAPSSTCGAEYATYMCPIHDSSLITQGRVPYCQVTCPYYDSVNNYINAGGGD